MGRPSKARDLAVEVLKTMPHDLPSLNNLGTAHLQLGQLEEAIQAAQQVLQLCPDNVHALANLVIFHVRAGRPDEAGPFAVRLKASGRDGSIRWTNVGEALSYLGDDQGVIDAHRRAQTLWKKSAQDGFSPAQDNLCNARLPAGQRHSPWAFGLEGWLDMHKLAACVDQKNAQRALLKKMPELVTLLPLLLDRGDPTASLFCLGLAQSSQHPGLLESLRDFALSQRGTEALRLSAAQACREAGLLP